METNAQDFALMPNTCLHNLLRHIRVSKTQKTYNSFAVYQSHPFFIFSYTYFWSSSLTNE